MITYVDGDILATQCQALICTTNGVGVMGAGLAKQVALRWPHIEIAYKQACKAGQQKPGALQIVATHESHPAFVINFPTKRHWREDSKASDIALGLQNLPGFLRQQHIQSLAIPPLGCGLGGLNWAEVHPMIVDTFKGLEFEIAIFGAKV